MNDNLGVQKTRDRFKKNCIMEHKWEANVE